MSAAAELATTPLDAWRDRVSGGTAVERFARDHDAGSQPAGGRHRQLLPLAAPGPGEQYAFEVDLDSCTGCKGCVAACHSLNGLDEGESWRTVGTLVATGGDGPGVQHVTTACHHCVDPACLAGCPVDAYEKDPVTGIVAHLDDQCIGCRYCVLTCPYEVPRFNEQRGIVRKCDLCRGRLAEGEAPACAQACPNGAITVAVVEVAAVAAATRGGALVPGAPPSALTGPTTTFRSTRPDGGLRQADDEVRPSEAHPPLSIMLVLTQAAVGAVLVALALQHWAAAWVADVVALPVAVVGPAAGTVAIAASVGHLGRPLLAWRAVLGFRHSWLSREILAFGAFGPLAGLLLVRPGWLPLQLAAALAGLAGVACSALVYSSTGRWCWRPTRTAGLFAGTAATAGLAAVLAAGLLAGAAVDEHLGAQLVRSFGRPLALALLAASVLKLGTEALELRHARQASRGLAHRAAALRCGPLAAQTRARFALGAVGGVAVPLLVAAAPPPNEAAALAVVGAAAVLGGEVVERWQFFTAAAAPRMPGVLP